MTDATMSPPEGSARDGLEASGAAVAGTGAAAAAVVAGACCVGPALAPIIVGVLGAGGAAWAAGFAPWAPWLLAGSFLLLAFGFHRAYRGGRACRTRSVLVARGILWIAAAIWIGALVLNLASGA